MNPTSHFLGISLQTKIIADLFVDLQSYLYKNSIQQITELQNPLSVHITLYYLPKKIAAKMLLKLKSQLAEIKSSFNEKIYLNSLKTFKRNNKNFVYYLSPNKSEKLKQINTMLSSKFPNSVEDNNFEFTAHMTLLKVYNPEAFAEHEDNIINIVNTHLSKISTSNSFLDINLYAVSSNYKPELQVII